jgi:sulfatase modifying factor 1
MVRRRLLGMVSLLPWSLGCSRTVPEGGLVVVLHTDGTLEPRPDTLHVDVGSPDGGSLYVDASHPIGDPHAFPVNFAIDSNGDPHASVGIVAGVSRSGVRTSIETLRYVVDAIPTDQVAELDVVFSAACAPQATCDAGTGAACCCPADACMWAGGTCQCDATALPTYPVDAGQSVSRPMNLTDAGTPPDATVDPGRDADKTVPDSSSCEAGAVQCADIGAPQRCSANGQWQDQPACVPGSTYCFQGGCVSLPTSCVGALEYSDCASYEVPAGAFRRGNDPLHEDAGAPATISAFRLDAFEITVWRFRAFVNEVLLGAGLPDAGAGTHVHLAGGLGLQGDGDSGARESGWSASWNAMFSTQPAQWDTNLFCANSATWSASVGANDASPVNCVTWYEAYAFCIWDGGFLPSEAEWNYAAAGGAAQRLYPWGSMDPGTSSEYADYGALYPQPTGLAVTTAANIAAVGSFPMGAGPFGQQDLAGNVSEWTLDFYDATYPTPCNDCTAVSPGTQRVFRGGGFDRGLQYLYTSSRVPADPGGRFPDVGVRCARVP